MKSVVSRWISIMILICIVGMTLLVVLGAALSGNSLVKESLEKIYNGVLAESLRIDGWMKDKVSYISALASDYNFMEDKSSKTLQELFTAQLESDPEIFAIYIGYPDGTAVFNDGWIPGSEWRSYNRGWYKGAVENNGKIYISPIYTDAQTGEYFVSVSKAITDDSGKLAGVICADIFVTVVQKIVFDTNVAEKSYAFTIDGAGDILIHPDEKYSPVYHVETDEDEFKNIKEVDKGLFAGMWEKTQKNKYAAVTDSDGVKKQFTSVEIPSLNWRLYVAVPTSVVNAPLYHFLIILIPISLLIVAALIAAGFIIVKSLDKILRDSAVRLQQSATDIINTSRELLENADCLAQSGSQQAASIEQTSATMNQTASMVENNTKNTRQALILTGETAKETSTGIQKVMSLIEFMDELAESSKAISNVIETISAIASQTTILALNASVESARAGEAGKAFSVVSEEVRALAQKSNDAVKSTSAIIEKNAELTRQSIEHSREVSEAFEAISGKIEKVNQIVAEITNASDEQSRGVSYVNQALGDMEKITQSNAAISEESAAAANILQSHAEILQEVTDNMQKLVGQV